MIQCCGKRKRSNGKEQTKAKTGQSTFEILFFNFLGEGRVTGFKQLLVSPTQPKATFRFVAKKMVLSYQSISNGSIGPTVCSRKLKRRSWSPTSNTLAIDAAVVVLLVSGGVHESNASLPWLLPPCDVVQSIRPAEHRENLNKN